MIIRRDLYLNKLIEAINDTRIKIITGIRRSGKSFLLFEIFYAYLLSQGIKDNQIIQIHLDKKSESYLTDPDSLCEYVKDKIKDNKQYFLFIDEIQLCKEFESVLNEFLWIKNLNVYVTGSNSKFLSKDIITTFRGRSKQIHLSPLSFKEFYYGLNFNDFYKALEQYLIYGGLPYLANLKQPQSKKEYLNDLIQETYLKDVIERNNIKSVKVLEELVNIIASNIGSYTSHKKLANSFSSQGNKISQNTVKAYVEYLEDAFIIRKSTKYDIKGRKYINSPYKYYFTDLGLRNAKLNFRQIEESKLMENLIFNELMIRGYSVDTGVTEINEVQKDKTYIRKQLECDFVVNLGYERIYIQSVYSIHNEFKLEQEKRSLIRINDSFKKLIVVYDDIEKRIDDNGIVYISLKEFLLDGPIQNMFENKYDWNGICKIIKQYKKN